MSDADRPEPADRPEHLDDVPHGAHEAPDEPESTEAESTETEPAKAEPAKTESTEAEPANGEPEPVEEQEHPARRRARHRTAGILIGVLTLLLGFAIAVQVHSNSSSDSLSNASEADLINILDDQNLNADRLSQRIADLQNTLRELQVSGDRNSVAEQQAEEESQTLGILLGTLPATGPGVTVTITDPKRALKAEDLLDVIEELRGAGAEAIQFGPVRVSTSTNFTATADGISVDGQPLSPPYQVQAIGDAKTLDTALNIPGGVAATARAAGGDATVTERDKIDITVLRAVPNPKYATPSGR